MTHTMATCGLAPLDAYGRVFLQGRCSDATADGMRRIVEPDKHPMSGRGHVPPALLIARHNLWVSRVPQLSPF
jgi:hypothetical protein